MSATTFTPDLACICRVFNWSKPAENRCLTPFPLPMNEFAILHCFHHWAGTGKTENGKQ